MTATDFLTYVIPSVVAILAGGGAGGFVAWKLRRNGPPVELVPPASESERDPFTDAQLQIEAARLAEAHGLPPQGAALILARLRTLHDISKSKGWLKWSRQSS